MTLSPGPTFRACRASRSASEPDEQPTRSQPRNTGDFFLQGRHLGPQDHLAGGEHAAAPPRFAVAAPVLVWRSQSGTPARVCTHAPTPFRQQAPSLEPGPVPD